MQDIAKAIANMFITVVPGSKVAEQQGTSGTGGGGEGGPVDTLKPSENLGCAADAKDASNDVDETLPDTVPGLVEEAEASAEGVKGIAQAEPGKPIATPVRSDAECPPCWAASSSATVAAPPAAEVARPSDQEPKVEKFTKEGVKLLSESPLVLVLGCFGVDFCTCEFPFCCMCPGEILANYELGLIDIEHINTNNCRSLGMRLRRHCNSAGFQASFPNMAKMFEGTNAEKKQLLHEFLKAGENLQAIETTLEVQRTQEEQHEGTEMLLTVAQMREKGVSEWLGVLSIDSF